MVQPRSGRRVAVVTDSTASLPAALLDSLDIAVVPLQVMVDGVAHREGVDLSPGRLVEALRRGAAITTSQPGPEAFARAYARVAARGATEIVSVHLSSDLSGTVMSAELAAHSCGIPVRVVDSRTVGMGLGLAVVAAARTAVRSDVDGARVAQAAERIASDSYVVFTVDTLDYLRRGGRLGPVAAALGMVLGVRPVLSVRDGRLEVVEKLRTTARARERLVDLVLEQARRRDRFDVAVHHLGDPALAQAVAERLSEACGPGLQSMHVAEISAVVGAHVGPGMLAVVIARA